MSTYYLGDPNAPNYRPGDGYALMLRRYALDANLPWNHYLQGAGVTWDSNRLGNGSDPNWTGYGAPGVAPGMAPDPSGTNQFSIAYYQQQTGYTGTGTPGSFDGSYGGSGVPGSVEPPPPQPQTPPDTGTPPPPNTGNPPPPNTGTPPGPVNPPPPPGPVNPPPPPVNPPPPPPSVDDSGVPPDNPPPPGNNGQGTTTTTNSTGTNTQTGSQTNTTMSGVSPQLQQLFNMLAGSGMDLFNRRMSGQDQMPGSVAGLNADQLNSQNLFRQLAGTFDQRFVRPTQDQQNQFYAQAKDPFSNPALKSMMDEHAKNVNQAASDPGGIWSNIRNDAVGAGQFGSSRQGIAEGIAAGRISDAITEGNTNLLNEAYKTNQNAALGAMGHTDMLARLGTMPGQLLSAVGQQNYDQESRQLEDNLNRWLFRYEEPNRAMEMLSGIFNTGLPTGSGSTSSSNATGTSTNTGTSTSTSTMPQWYIDLMQQQGQGGSGNSGLGALLGILGVLGLGGNRNP